MNFKGFFALFLCSFSCICFSSTAQTDQIIVEYNVIKNYIQSTYHLVHQDELSYWKEITEPELINNNINYAGKSNYEKEALFKDLKNNTMFSKYKVLEKMFYVKDPLPAVEWEILDSTTVFLGYQCQLAKTRFRGRSYLALYSTEIAAANGPWKFSGLPGLILKVSSMGGYEAYVFECTKITQTKKENLNKAYLNYVKENKKKEFISWETFTSGMCDHIENYKKILISSQEADDSGYSLNFKAKNYMEIFNEPLQTEGITMQF